MSNTLLIILGIGLLIVIILVFSIYNKLVTLRNRVENAWAQIDVQIKRRFDLIPNLVETVKGYAQHEKETLDDCYCCHDRHACYSCFGRAGGI